MSTARPSTSMRDLAVLRAAPLDDVHAGQDLDAADERRAHRAGQVEHVVQRAVDAVADPDPVVLRLDVDVGGAVAQRLGDDHLDDLDDRGVVVGHVRCSVRSASRRRLSRASNAWTWLLDADQRPVAVSIARMRSGLGGQPQPHRVA